jgi:hypothetical protein
MDCPWTLHQMERALKVLKAECSFDLFGRPVFDEGLRSEPLDPLEIAKLGKARRQPGKIQSLLPKWLKHHLAQSRIPDRESFDFRQRLPKAGTYNFNSWYFVT